MKNSAKIIWFLILIALGAFAIFQQEKISRTQAQLTSVQTQLANVQNQLKEKSEADEKIAFAERKAKILQNVLTETSAYATKQSEQVTQLQSSLAAAKTNSANPFAALFKDPKMRAMIKAQQQAVLGPMIEKQYTALFQQLNLTPEQAATLKDLLQKKMSVSTDIGMSMLDNSLDASQRADLTRQIKSQTDDYNDQIQQLLGADDYQTFQDYEKTAPDRMMVSQFNDQLGSSAALSSDQQQQLIQAMQDTSANFKWTTDLNNPNNVANGDFASMFTPDKIDQFAQQKEQFDQQILTKAQQILTPDQINQLQQFQTSQRNLQIAGMKMAANMFGQKSQ